MDKTSITNHARSTPRKLGLIFLFLIIVYIILTGAIYYVTQASTPGTDFYIYYAAGRNILSKGISPYSENVGEESQMAVLKRPALENEDQLRFVYPPYALIPVLPLVSLPFGLAQAAWMAFGFLTLSISFALAFQKPPIWLMASLLALYPIFFGFLLGNFDILIISLIFLLVGRIPHIRFENQAGQIFLGICLAWITVKPQFTWFYVLFFLVLASRKKLRVLLISFAAGIATFLVISFLLVPNWIAEWINRVLLYPTYTGGNISITPLLKQFVSPVYFPVIYLVCFFMLGSILILLFRKWMKQEISSLPLFAFGGFMTFFFHPHGNAYEQLTFLISVILWIIQWARSRPGKALLAWIILVGLSWIIFVISKFAGLPEVGTNGLYLFYLIWLVFGLILPPRFLKGMDIP
jgi:hypothetical protein